MTSDGGGARIWSADELAVLMSGAAVPDIAAQLPGRTEKAIEHRLRRLKIQPVDDQTAERWSGDEDALLAGLIGNALRPDYPALMAQLPGRSRKSIERRVKRLRRRDVRESDIAELQREALACIGRHPHLSKHSFSMAAVNSPSLFATMAAGRYLSPRLIRKVRLFIERCDAGHYPPAPVSARRGNAALRASRTRARWEEEEAARLHRETDPAERAKAFIRRQRFYVFNAELIGGPVGHYRLGHRTVSLDEMLDFARARGWEG